MKLSKTNGEVIYFIHTLNNANLGGDEKLKTKAQQYALGTLRSLEKNFLAEYNSQLEDIRIKHCAVDDSKIIIKDDKGNLAFTRDGQMALKKDLKTLNQAMVEIDIRQYPESDFSVLDEVPDVKEYLVEFGYLIGSLPEDNHSPVVANEVK